MILIRQNRDKMLTHFNLLPPKDFLTNFADLFNTAE